MKKRTMAVGGLLLAVAMTGYSVAGTYAKYVSSIDLTDEARVAKWDFNTAQELDLFASSYKLVGEKGEYTYVQSLTQKKNAEGNPMFEEDGITPIYDNVIAPGTHGSSVITFAGKTETNYKLHFDVTDIVNTVKVAADNEANKTGKEYAPVKFTVSYSYNDKIDGKTTPIRETSSSLANAIEAVNQRLDKMVFGPTDRADAEHYLEISWAWAFDAYDVVRISEANSSNGADAWDYTNEYIEANFADDLNYAKTQVNDELDTLLGAKAADGEDLSIKLNISAVVEQTKEQANTNFNN